MKKLGTRFVVFAFMAFAAFNVGATTITINGVEWTYGIQRNNATTNAYITRAAGDVSGNITIPAYLEGAPVTEIRTHAFANCTDMASIMIPRTVTYFYEEAFHNCTGLNAVHIDDVATWCLAYFSYRWNSNRQNLTCNPLIQAQNLYVNGELVTDLVVPEGVTSIGGGFRGYTKLTSVVIPDSCRISSVADLAFSCCTSLKRVYIGDSVGIDKEYFGLNNGTFAYCTSLTQVRLGGHITSLSSDSGYSGTFAECTSLGSIEIPVGVTSIGDNSGGRGLFRGCTSLTNVTFQGSVTAIGYEAFCLTGLKHFAIPPTVKSIGADAFSSTPLVDVTIPPSVKTIRWQAFRNCTRLSAVYIDDLTSWCSIDFELSSNDNPAYSGNPLLHGPELYVAGFPVGKTLYIPNGVTDIAKCAFYGWTNITSVTMADSVKEIGRNAFGACNGLRSVVIGDGVSDIQYGAFQDCKRLANVTFGNRLTNIENSAFARCTDLRSVVIPDNVIDMGYSVFTGCSALESVVMGNNVTSIRGSMFQNCYALKSIVMGNNVASIGSSAFYNCWSLECAIIPNSVTNLGECAFDYCRTMKSLTVGDGLSSIPATAFGSCTNLTSVWLGSHITSIDHHAFESCIKLAKINFPNGLKNIGRYAFGGCRELKEVFMPPSLENIDAYAFQYCSNLEKVVFTGNAPTSGWSFGDVKAGCTAYVPWLSEGWNVPIPGTWNGINIAYLFTGNNVVEEAEELPETIVIQSDAEVTVRGSPTPAELKAQLLALLARVEAMGRGVGQDPACYKVVGRCDEANGTITLKAVLDAERLGLSETLASVLSPDTLSAFQADGTVRLANVKDGFYYGLAAAERLEDLDAAVAAVKANGLTRAENGEVTLSNRKPIGKTMFFRMVADDRE